MSTIVEHLPYCDQCQFCENIYVNVIICTLVLVAFHLTTHHDTLQFSTHLTSLQAYADYMGFVLTLNEGVKGKKLTCEYKVSEVCCLSYQWLLKACAGSILHL